MPAFMLRSSSSKLPTVLSEPPRCVDGPLATSPEWSSAWLWQMRRFG